MCTFSLRGRGGSSHRVWGWRGVPPPPPKKILLVSIETLLVALYLFLPHSPASSESALSVNSLTLMIDVCVCV